MVKVLTVNGKIPLVDGMAISATGGGGGGSVPKPLTYDYMPEGYPKKSVQITTLMEEQELAFELPEGMSAYTTSTLLEVKISSGQTYIVVWDGVEYECVGFAFNKDVSAIGNPSIEGVGDNTGEPFIYAYNSIRAAGGFSTLDTSASHTISIKTTQEIVTPMAEEFLPAAPKNTTVFYL